MRPRIAVTTTLGTGGRHQLPQVKLNVQYLTAVDEPGGTPLLLSPAHTEDAVAGLMELAHGLLLTGGEDVSPERYGQEPHPELGYTLPARDDLELAALAEALRRGMPVLAICRGVQLLNVAMGGTLFQDLPSQRPGPLVHEQEAPVGHHWHGASVQEGSRFHGIVGTDTLLINSFHHQAIDRLGRGLAPVAWAEDGVVEAVEGTEHPWVFGVQWHPERGEAATRLDDRRDPDRRLLWAFVDAARDYAQGATVLGREERKRRMAGG